MGFSYKSSSVLKTSHQSDQNFFQFCHYYLKNDALSLDHRQGLKPKHTASDRPFICVQTGNKAHLGLTGLVSLLHQIFSSLFFDKPCSTHSSSSKHKVNASQCYVTTQWFPHVSAYCCDSSSEKRKARKKKILNEIQPLPFRAHKHVAQSGSRGLFTEEGS